MILDILVGTVIVGGSALMALGAFGLVRFPDVFTRMHSATKAATVGVIATTTAASVEAAGISGTAILVVTVILLFLSAPLGMSLLARAAYHDPETPRVRSTRELEFDLPIPESTTTSRYGGTSPFLAIWLFVVWIAAFGSLAWNVVLGGAAVSVVVAWAFRHIAPRWPSAFLHPIAALRFVRHFSAQLIVATWDVIVSLRFSGEEIQPAVLEVPLRVTTRNEVTLLMNAISFTPGTVALELHGANLYVHVLNTDDPSNVVQEIRTMEGKIMAAFSTGGEVLDAGD